MTTSLKKLHNRWHRALAKHWSANPITYCEVRFIGCFGTYGLSPAHSRDRYDIRTQEEFNEVVAACNFCHTKLDQKMSKVDRLFVVKEVIKKREI